ncbi:hypothetical protein Cni_G13956 [Canna indica]|uniref:DUF7806 domain-containing protein n=1 Tax=Canna indica TaxID=4628 RepID=A0AAQ3KAU5_9LILI|nr:hypothetical protein Cni_G13956 [Canna indica]
MELFNTKLYEKYKKLKKSKFVEEEEWNNKRDSELRDYQSAMEDLIEELKNSNEGLQAQLYSFQEKYAECEKLMLKEAKKSQELSDEIGTLQDLLFKKNNTNYGSLATSTSTTPQVRSVEISKSPSRQETPEPCEEDGTQNRGAAILTCDSYKFGTDKPDCCKINLVSSGNTSEGCRSCIFQTLMRFLVGMDFSVDSQAENLCLLVVHKMSGYSFSLTWMQHEGEGEWMYRVSSLGTLERVALDWMKEEMIFSATMCRIFFERVSRVIGRG